MAAQGALGEVEVTNVEEVAEGRVRGLADARSVDIEARQQVLQAA